MVELGYFLVYGVLFIFMFSIFSWEHAPFKIFLFLNWLVFYFAPYLNFALPGPKAVYPLEASLHLLIFYIVPFCFFYFLIQKKYSRARQKNITKAAQNFAEIPWAGKKHCKIYSILMFGLAVVSCYVILVNGFLYLRIGYAELAKAYLELSFLSHLILKINEDLGGFIFALNLFLIVNVKVGMFSKILIIASLTQILIFTLLNSRYDVVAMLLVFFILTISIKFGGVFNLKKKILYLILPVLAVTSVSLVRNIYENTYVKNIEISQTFSKNQWVKRVNGMAMYSDIYKKSEIKGFMLGEAWGSALLYYYWLFDRQRYVEIKYDLKTNSKVLIHEFFNDEAIEDTTSSYLSDVYANFSAFGVFAFSVIMAFLLSILKKGIRVESFGGLYFFLTLWVLYRIFYVNSTFITVVLNCVKLLPLVIFLWWIFPVKKLKEIDNYEK